MDKPSAGRIVRYVCKDGKTIRPAIITGVTAVNASAAGDPESVHLTVFFVPVEDMGQEAMCADAGIASRPWTPHDESKRAGSWHWPSRT